MPRQWNLPALLLPPLLGVFAVVALQGAWLAPAAAGAPAAADLTAELVPVAPDLQAVDVGHAGDGSGRLVLALTEGVLRVIDDGVLLPEPLLDISDRVVCCGESGLASFAFHPDFPSRGELFVLYSRTGSQLGLAPDSVLSRFRLLGDESGLFDADSEEILLRIPEPASNHNGNDLEFGPDGYLYLSAGDGGGQEDAFGNGQNGAAWNGKILRLDPDGGAPYAVPDDNPFVGDPAVLDEIWALGLRNPWRMAFDAIAGDLWIADAGQARWEEVNRLPLGAGGRSFGWSEMEGEECFVAGCDASEHELPEIAYCHGEVEGCPFPDDCAIVGARRYRGHRAPALYGALVFADFCSGRIRAAVETVGASGARADWEVRVLLETELSLITLGEGEDGELYVSSFDGVFRLKGLPEGFSDGFERGTLEAWSSATGRVPAPRPAPPPTARRARPASSR